MGDFGSTLPLPNQSLQRRPSTEEASSAEGKDAEEVERAVGSLLQGEALRVKRAERSLHIQLLWEGVTFVDCGRGGGDAGAFVRFEAKLFSIPPFSTPPPPMCARREWNVTPVRSNTARWL